MNHEWALYLGALSVVLGVKACTPADNRVIVVPVAGYESELLHCQDVGRDANSYRVYEACTKEAGL